VRTVLRIAGLLGNISIRNKKGQSKTRECWSDGNDCKMDVRDGLLYCLLPSTNLEIGARLARERIFVRPIGRGRASKPRGQISRDPEPARRPDREHRALKARPWRGFYGLHTPNSTTSLELFQTPGRFLHARGFFPCCFPFGQTPGLVCGARLQLPRIISCCSRVRLCGYKRWWTEISPQSRQEHSHKLPSALTTCGEVSFSGRAKQYQKPFFDDGCHETGRQLFRRDSWPAGYAFSCCKAGCAVNLFWVLPSLVRVCNTSTQWSRVCVEDQLSGVVYIRRHY